MKFVLILLAVAFVLEKFAGRGGTAASGDESEISELNPATGLSMVNESMDGGGNMYGTDSSSSSHDD